MAEDLTAVREVLVQQMREAADNPDVEEGHAHADFTLTAAFVVLIGERADRDEWLPISDTYQKMRKWYA